MLLLAENWSKFASDGNSVREQQGLLEDMATIVKTGKSKYRGVDPMRLDYNKSFSEDLTKQEQKFLHKKAKKAIKHSAPWKRFISTTEINEYFKNPPKVPYYVSLDESLAPKDLRDGSERYPFVSVEEATKQLRRNAGGMPEGGDTVVIVKECAPDCKRRPCFFAGCNRQVCESHGCSGVGKLDYERRWVCFPVSGCIACDKLSCYFHERRCFKDCDVCHEGFQGEAALGMHNGSPDACFSVCKDCGKSCDKDDEEGDPCGFYCCPKCIGSHKCNDRPTDYI